MIQMATRLRRSGYGAASPSPATARQALEPELRFPSMIPASEALDRLREGNRRFVSGRSSSESVSGGARRREIADNQTPFAIVLGCSDSRVPAEIVFDQGLGDLFVIRVAGNIVAPSQVGSV